MGSQRTEIPRPVQAATAALDLLSSAVLVRVGGALNARVPATLAAGAAERDTASVERDLRAARDAGARLAVLVGGEPTMRRTLPALFGACGAAGLAPGLVSNGRALAYPQIRRRLIAGGLTYLQVAIHGAVAATHDTLVGVRGAFAEATAGLFALVAEAPPSLHVDVACTVTQSNAHELEALCRLVAGWQGPATRSVRFVAPLNALVPGGWLPADLVAATLGATLRLDALGIPLSWEGFPPCLLEEHAALRDERLRYGVKAFGPPSAGGALADERPGALSGTARVYPYPCQDCVHEPTCPGAPQAFLDADGEQGLRPTKGVRANSFNYEFREVLPDFRLLAGACSARALRFDGALSRHILLARDGGVARYHSPAADFTDAEIAVVKDEIEQIYIDLSEGAALTDFMTDVRRVRFHAECRRCPDKPVCAGAVEVIPTPPFGPEEDWLRAEVGRARGRVLDVGCGEQPYREELAALIAAERIDYHGLDPDRDALARFRAAGVGGTLHEGVIEDFPGEDAGFDIVLAFRSFNHFFDLEKAFLTMARLLKPGGLLYLCDSPPFAMLRTPSQVAYADEHATYGHEHYRNWRSEQVVAFLARFPFDVEVHRPVSPSTSNLWLLKASRRGTRS